MFKLGYLPNNAIIAMSTNSVALSSSLTYIFTFQDLKLNYLLEIAIIALSTDSVALPSSLT